MSVIYSIKEFINQTVSIQKSNGIAGLLKVGLRFAYSPVYKTESFWLTTNKISAEFKSEASKPRVSMDRLSFKVITSNKEADSLEAQGYFFRSHPTYFNHGLTLYRKWLDLGAVACCTFVDKEFAAINWIIPSRKTQYAIKAAPIKIDYEKKEIFTRSAWSNPKYRGLGIYYYTGRYRNRYLLEKGYITSRGVVAFDNKNGRGIATAGGSRLYGTGKLTRILWWNNWQEQYFPKPIEWSEADNYLLSLKAK